MASTGSSRSAGLEFLEAELHALDERGLLRSPVVRASAQVACSNDYLGYAARGISPEERDLASRATGAGASRLVSGEHPEHLELETALAGWVHLEAALLFSSGYAANVGMLSSLLGVGDVVVSDALNHASIVDGCRLGRAEVRVVPHLDADAVAKALSSSSARRRFVVTEAYFSMDGDVPDLRALREICDRHDAALIVDEAHSLGIFGPNGSGLCREQGVVPDVLVGTLGKAVGLQGAFVAGRNTVRSWLWNRARSFVFSTGTSPYLVALTHRRVERVIADEPGRARLHALVARFREGARELGVPIATSVGPIVPWVVGEPAAVLERRDRLLDAGWFVQAIRPPTVPEGTSRLRVTLHTGLSDADVDALLLLLAREHRRR